MTSPAPRSKIVVEASDPPRPLEMFAGQPAPAFDDHRPVRASDLVGDVHVAAWQHLRLLLLSARRKSGGYK